MENQETIRLLYMYVAQRSLAVLTTIDEAGKPWGAAVYVGVDHNFDLYFTTKSQTEKSRSIKQNPNVSVVIVDEGEQSTLQLQGEARVISDPYEAETASKAIREVSIKSDDWMPPIAKLHAGEYELFKVTVSYAKLRSFGDRRKGEGPKEWEYRTS